MSKEAQKILILDASVLVNFLAINRAGLVGRSAPQVLIIDHVTAEITVAYPEQMAALRIALDSSIIHETTITDIQEHALLAKLRAGTGRKQLGIGECSAIAVAIHRGYELALDDTAAIKFVKKAHAHLTIHTTQDVMLGLILGGHLTIQEADAIKRDWETNHQFRLKITSFSDHPKLMSSPPRTTNSK